MWAVWALSACAWAAGAPLPPSPAGGDELRVDPRPRLPILLITPPGFDSSLRGSDVIDATARVLDRTSGIDGVSPEQAGLALDALDRCTLDDRFACAVRLIRDLPLAVRSSGWALLVLLRPSASGDERLDLQLIEIEPAAAALAATPPGEALEDAIFRHARPLPPVMRGEARDASALAERMTRAVAGPLAQLLPPAPSGTIDLALACAPCQLAFDGRWLAHVETSALRLTHAPLGEHHLTLTRGSEARDYAVVIAGAEPVQLDARDFASPGADAVIGRGLLVGAGVAALVVGSALVVAGHSSGADVVCLRSASTDGCASIGPWARVDRDPLVATTSWSPLLLAGAGLAGAGLSWGGAGLLGDGLDPLWATLIAAVGAGVGLTVATVGSAP